MAKEFKLTKEYLGYQTKRDITNVDVRSLGLGSKNVLVNAGEKIAAAPGYTIYGPTKTGDNGITSSCDWVTSSNSERHLRAFYDKLQYWYKDASGNITWRDLLTGLGTSVNFRFITESNDEGWWNNTEKIDMLLFCNGTADVRSWSGAITTIASNTATTLTKEGTGTWAESRFLVSGTRKVVVDGVEYAYTGGEGTTTLTGLSGLPTFSVGAICHQAVTVHASVVSASAKHDYIGMHNNQIYYGSDTRREVYVSKTTSYTDVTYSSPRVPGEGMLLTLDATCKGFATQEDAMYISAGRSLWYQTVFTLSSDNTKETLSIKKLQTGAGQGAKSQELIGKIKNSVAFVSNEPTFDTLGRIENIDTPQSKPISDPIRPDFEVLDFTNGHHKFYLNQSFLALPADGLVYIYDYSNQYWQPPQTLGISRFTVIEGILYGHSSVCDETYKLFDKESYTHNGNAIHSKAVIPYNSYGERAWQKKFDEYYWEGYASLQTIIGVSYFYDFGGSSKTLANKKIDMGVERIKFHKTSDGSLGKSPLGSHPLGTILDTPADLAKFRAIQTMSQSGFYEMAVVIETNDKDFKWEIISHGPNSMLSTSDNIAIKI